MLGTDSSSVPSLRAELLVFRLRRSLRAHRAGPRPTSRYRPTRLQWSRFRSTAFHGWRSFGLSPGTARHRILMTSSRPIVKRFRKPGPSRARQCARNPSELRRRPDPSSRWPMSPHLCEVRHSRLRNPCGLAQRSARALLSTIGCRSSRLNSLWSARVCDDCGCGLRSRSGRCGSRTRQGVDGPSSPRSEFHSVETAPDFGIGTWGPSECIQHSIRPDADDLVL